MANNIIELNGKIYDAATGDLLDKTSARQTVATVAPHKLKRRTVDGFIGTPKKPMAAVKTPVAKISSAQTTHKPRTAAKNVAHHKPEHSKTLARTIKKPQPKAKNHHTQSLAGTLPAKHVAISSIAKSKPDKNRLERAKSIKTSEAISRFRKSAPIKYVLDNTFASPAEPIATKPQKVSPGKTKQDLINKGLARADSHTRPKPAVRKPFGKLKRIIAVLATVAVLVAAVALLILQIPSLNTRFVSFRSGIAIQAPSYFPAGYKLSKSITYSSGNIKLTYQNSNGLSYTLDEQRSNWDSESLRDTFVVGQDAHYQVAQSKGQLVYLYGKGNATWVNGGTWYQINSGGFLDSSQILQITGSL